MHKNLNHCTHTETVFGQLSSLPSQISYTTSLVISPQNRRKALIPRRALFDVKIQIMAESDDNNDGDDTLTTSKTNEQHDIASDEKDSSHTGKSFKNQDVGLGDSDIEKDVYEGGFKSWEGAVDLAQLLLDTIARDEVDELREPECIVEVRYNWSYSQVKFNDSSNA